MTSQNTVIDPLQDERLSALLASPDFSIAAYLNTALDLSTSGDESQTTTDEQHRKLEQQMANLALQLQIRTQSCHDEIGRIGAELQAVLPRCCSDVGRVTAGLDGMEMDLTGLIMEDSKSDEKNEDDPLTTLHTLLNLKAHLSSARTILSVASSWDETIRSIPALLAASNDSSQEHGDVTSPSASRHLIDAVEALSTLEAGERVLRVMPSGKEEREEVLTTLRSRTEAMLKPQLLHALKNTETRTALLRQCVQMYGSLGKLDVLKEEYVKARPGEVIGLWFSFGGSSSSAASATGGGNVGESEQNGVDDILEDNAESAVPASSAASTVLPKQQFTDFLPDFYEAVLELLAKERNQARLVFGAELAPSVVAKVLMECFKPIVSSFRTRLENLCPLPNSLGVSSSSAGGIEAIAMTYESTVQFLSLVYDQIEAWDASSCDAQAMIQSNKEDGSNSQELLEMIRNAFLLIASPFTPYQKSLAEVERHPLGAAASIVARDVRSVNSLQDSPERLGDLAPFVFPLAQGECVCRLTAVNMFFVKILEYFCLSIVQIAVVDRFELFNCGYNAPSTFSVIDELLSNHASELAIAMGSLSGNATAGPEFDEQHVHCALEVLRITGVFKRDLISFQSLVRDRLRTMATQMMNTVLDSPNADIPDVLSPAQIRVMLAKEACSPSTSACIDDGTGAKLSLSVVQLRELAGLSSESKINPPLLFPKALDSISRLARSSQSFVFEVCLAIPERHLRGISALPIWKQEGSGVEEDSYGILPQAYITHVGEHMLALVQALEPFASDSEALGLANEVMAGVREVAVQPWKEFVAAAGCSSSRSDDSETLLELMLGNTLTKYLSNEEDDIAESAAQDHEENEEDIDSADSTAFCNLWLDVVGMAVTGRLLERTMRIPRLGKKGAEHLAADLNYIRNVFTALGVTGHPNPLLQYAAQLASMKQEQFQERTRDRDTSSSGALDVICKMEDRMASVRSISL